MKKIALAKILPVFVFTTCAALLAAPSFGIQETERKEKSKTQQKKSDSETPEKEKEQKKKSKPKKQIRTHTQRIGRMLENSRGSNAMIEIVNPLTTSASEATVAVMSGKKQVALGMIVDADGYILTKASELAKDLSVVSGEESYEATVYGIDSKTDLALLKIEAENMTVAKLESVELPALGNWLACPGPGEEPFSIGIVAVEARRISGSRAFVGIMPVDAEDRDGVRIDSVTADSPADHAGLRINDIILKIDDANTNKVTELRAKLAKHEPGDRVTLTVERGDKEMTIDMELAAANTFMQQAERINQQNRMGSVLSKRRSGFPLVFQTDVGLNANQCGGPIVDLTGNIVGINIARAERVSSLALPVETILPVIELLKSGELAPAFVNRSRIKAIESEIAELSQDLDLPKLESRKNKLRLKVDVAQARRDEIKKQIAGLELRLEKIDELEEEETELKKLSREITSNKRSLKKLEEERESLKSGLSR